jgi:hypothetical protein
MKLLTPTSILESEIISSSDLHFNFNMVISDVPIAPTHSMTPPMMKRIKEREWGKEGYKG